MAILERFLGLIIFGAVIICGIYTLFEWARRAKVALDKEDEKHDIGENGSK